MTLAGVRHRMNEMGKKGIPFFFILDYELQDPLVMPLHQLPQYPVRIALDGKELTEPCQCAMPERIIFQHEPVPFPVYEIAFQKVTQAINRGDSYLVNLTFPTKITTNLTLQTIYANSRAPFKLFYDNRFVVFSPERFVQIRKGMITSCPMKGTIEASIPGAKDLILNDFKEAAEHATIVDLIRNDLSMVSEKVQVTRYRYLDLITSHDKELYQVSSEITGRLSPGYRQHLGDIMYNLLPAGSISGAPKRKTMEIIREAEEGPRGFYTGVFGVFDGKNLDSAVMIRFIEKQKNGQLLYRSGGGITSNSTAKAEYLELNDKIYLPFPSRYSARTIQ